MPKYFWLYNTTNPDSSGMPEAAENYNSQNTFHRNKHEEAVGD
jgi:hypothetical protein